MTPWLMVAALFLVTFGISNPIAAFGVFLPVIGDEERTDPARHHQVDGFAHGDLLRQHDDRRRHDLVDAVTIGVRIDLAEDAHRLGPARRIGPARALMLLHGLVKGETRPLRLGKRADAAPGELRQHGCEDFGRGASVAHGRVAAGYVDIEPAGQHFQRLVGQGGIGHHAQHADAKPARGLPFEPGKPRLALQDGEIVADGMADQDAPVVEGPHASPGLGKAGGALQHIVGNAVNGGRGRRHRLIRGNQCREGLVVLHPARRDGDAGHLDDPGPAHVERGGFGVECHGLQRRKRSCPVYASHSLPLLQGIHSIARGGCVERNQGKGEKHRGQDQYVDTRQEDRGTLAARFRGGK